MVYLTIFYLCVLAVFVSALGGFTFYRVSDKKFSLSKTISYLLGGIVSILLSYPITKFLQDMFI
jgi:hypothetical protein